MELLSSPSRIKKKVSSVDCPIDKKLLEERIDGYYMILKGVKREIGRV